MNQIATREALFAQELITKYRRGEFNANGPGGGKRPVIPMDTLQGIASGTYKIADASIYVKANVAGKSSDHRILDANSDYKEGTINLDKGRLPKAQNHFFSRIVVGYAKDAVETDPALVQYTSVINSSNLDLALRGADLVITQGSRKLVDKPLEEFLAEASSHYPRGSRQVGLELDAVQYFTEGDQITIQLRFPSGQSVAAAGYHHIQVIIPGLQTVPR